MNSRGVTLCQPSGTALTAMVVLRELVRCVFQRRRDVPNMSERVLHPTASIAPILVLQGSYNLRAGIDRALEGGIGIGDIEIEMQWGTTELTRRISETLRAILGKVWGRRVAQHHVRVANRHLDVAHLSVRPRDAMDLGCAKHFLV